MYASGPGNLFAGIPFEVVDSTITAEQGLDRLRTADVLFVPANMDTPGKRSEDGAVIAAGGWNGVFQLLKDRPDFEAVAEYGPEKGDGPLEMTGPSK